MQIVLKDFVTFKKLISKGIITKMKLTESAKPSNYIDVVRIVSMVNDASFALKTEDGSISWFSYPSVSNMIFDGSNKVKIINKDQDVLLEYECISDSEIDDELLSQSKFKNKTSMMKELLNDTI